MRLIPKAGACAALLFIFWFTPVQSQSPAPSIRIVYEQPKNPALVKVQGLLREKKFLEKLQEIFGIVRLPKPPVVRAQQCDDVNAYYDYEKDEIVVCYELVAVMQQIAPAKTTPMGVTPDDAVAGPLALFAMHEMAHGIFNQLQIPVLGNVEDAADRVAFFAILQFSPEEAKRVIGGAAYFFSRLSEMEQVSRDTLANLHSLSGQRFYSLICLAYGADKKLFEGVVSKKFLPEERAEFCHLEYKQAAHAVQTLIRPHIDQTKRDQALSKKWLTPVPFQPERGTDRGVKAR